MSKDYVLTPEEGVAGKFIHSYVDEYGALKKIASYLSCHGFGNLCRHSVCGNIANHGNGGAKHHKQRPNYYSFYNGGGIHIRLPFKRADYFINNIAQNIRERQLRHGGKYLY